MMNFKPPQAMIGSHSWPILGLGFRPFYILAALWAVVAIPLWLGMLYGQVNLPSALPGYLWHAHEMIFGFAVAVIMGFLLTAVRNWTGLATPTGWPLAGLAMLWLIGRLVNLGAPLSVAAIVDLLFLPTGALMLARPLGASQQRRNYFVPVLLLALALMDAWFYREVALGESVQRPLMAALGLIITLVTVIAGRVIPMFTRNMAKSTQQYRWPWLENLIVPLTLLTFAGMIFWPQAWMTMVLASLAAVLHGLRAWGWDPRASKSYPMLWILHIAYAWIVVGFAGVALSALGYLSIVVVTHLFALGAMASMMMGMMTRTALGHTGRPLVAHYPETLMYALMPVALLMRIAASIIHPWSQVTPLWLIGSGGAWTLAFCIYLWRYGPWLLSRRVDGMPG